MSEKVVAQLPPLQASAGILRIKIAGKKRKKKKALCERAVDRVETVKVRGVGGGQCGVWPLTWGRSTGSFA